MIAVFLALALQTLTVTIPPNTPFEVTWKHDGLGMPMFRWWCNGAIVKNFSEGETMPVPLVTDATGHYTFTATVPGLPVGTHACFISAYNGVGEVKADPVPIVVAVPKLPSMPFEIRVVIKSGGGAP